MGSGRCVKEGYPGIGLDLDKRRGAHGMFHPPGLGHADMIYRGVVGRYVQVEFGVRNAIIKKVCQNCAHTGTIRLKLTCHRRYPRIHMLGSNLFH